MTYAPSMAPGHHDLRRPSVVIREPHGRRHPLGRRRAETSTNGRATGYILDGADAIRSAGIGLQRRVLAEIKMKQFPQAKIHPDDAWARFVSRFMDSDPLWRRLNAIATTHTPAGRVQSIGGHIELRRYQSAAMATPMRYGCALAVIKRSCPLLVLTMPHQGIIESHSEEIIAVRVACVRR